MRLEPTQEEEKHDRSGPLRLREICAFGRSPICLAGKKGAGLRMSFGLRPSRDPDQTTTVTVTYAVLRVVALLPQRFGEKPRQRLRFHGFDQVMVKTNFARLVPTFGLSPSGQR